MSDEITVYNITPAHRVLIEFIVQTEARGNYNAYWGHAGNQNPDLSKMTLADLQRWMVNRGTPQSSATGGPQFMSFTLFGKNGALGIVQQMKMPMTTLFTQATQDQLCTHLLIYRGFDAWVAGKITDAQFGNNLAFEWASLPRWTAYRNAKGRAVQPGQSAYAGDGLNKALVSLSSMQAVLQRAHNTLAGADAATVTKPEEAPEVEETATEVPAQPAAPDQSGAASAPLSTESLIASWFIREVIPPLVARVIAWTETRK